ncbi:Quinone oxidoreductase 1 [Raoultella terrigena]|uniref:Quinone oxidoreductase 1 n=1 Tax=Raoultella terrigena TaxID=577 RepID=A0A4U9DAH7_RAOTE|nr:Quinone oxidoreductase 1 [Raoultella terrigena]
MATRIEFHKHGGPEVLQVVEFVAGDPAEHEIQVENKAIVSTTSIPTFAAASIRPLRFRAD